LSAKDRILIIDDDKYFTKTFSDILQEEGYDTTVAHSGAEALEILEDNFFALLIVDIKLPDIDGIELISRIKETDPDMRKVILTGNPSMDNIKQALKRGANDYLVKPVKFEEILEAIKNQIDELESELREKYKSLASSL